MFLANPDSLIKPTTSMRQALSSNLYHFDT